jgi:hypothetical protein
MTAPKLNTIPRKLRIRRVLQLAWEHCPESVVKELDELLAEMYNVAKLACAPSEAEVKKMGPQRTDLEDLSKVPIEFLKVGEWMMVPSHRIHSVRQKIWRIRNEGIGGYAGGDWETKKLKGGYHRVTRLE